ncbi:MAG: hypothetical protein WAM14_11720 [Candidatus Nitrosopolaris sp.]
MTKQYRMLIVFNQTEKILDQEKIRQHMEFAGFHIINMKMNSPMGSKQNTEIYYESDIPFPFRYASSMIREQKLDTEVAFLQEVQNEDCTWVNVNKTPRYLPGGRYSNNCC